MFSKRQYFDGDTFTRGNMQFRVTFPYDDTSETPWEREDGHGIVSDWTSRDKRPGERILAADRGLKMFYDVAASQEKAIAEGWDAEPFNQGTKRQQAARAVEKDYEYLRAWCNEQWCYLGVVVELLDKDGEPTGETDSVWGIESDAYEYLAETANELADQIVSAHREAWLAALKEARQRRYWATRDVVTQ